MRDVSDAAVTGFLMTLLGLIVVTLISSAIYAIGLLLSMALGIPARGAGAIVIGILCGGTASAAIREYRS